MTFLDRDGCDLQVHDTELEKQLSSPLTLTWGPTGRVIIDAAYAPEREVDSDRPSGNAEEPPFHWMLGAALSGFEILANPTYSDCAGVILHRGSRSVAVYVLDDCHVSLDIGRDELPQLGFRIGPLQGTA